MEDRSIAGAAQLRKASLDVGKGIALHYQLKSLLAQQIESAVWRTGNMLPPERELAAAYEVSVGTVRQAMAGLVRDGLLVRRSGKGTFVARPKLEGNLNKWYSITSLIEQQGLVPGTRVLSAEVVALPAPLAAHLGVAEGEGAIKLERLRLASGNPFSLNTVHIPHSLCPGIVGEDLEALSLFYLLKTKYGVPLRRQSIAWEAVALGDYEGYSLGAKRGMPALKMEIVTYTDLDVPAVYSEDIIRGDRLKYRIDIALP